MQVGLNMELKLYNKLKELIYQGLDFDARRNASKIEEYSNEIILEPILLDKIKEYSYRYNDLIGREFKLRYYQILALYFTDYFFDNRNEIGVGNKMLAYWMATGSGKTIIMHINILQYLDRIEGFDKLQIILTTPGVNLIEQHKCEVVAYVEKLNTIYNNKIELIIETTSALLQKDERYFELPDDDRIQRLILVDEGHIGLTSSEEGEYKKLRDRMNIGNSFLLEYSATYDNLDPKIQTQYEDLIIYDYAYKHFFRDGYGKDYYFKQILVDVADNEDDNLKETLKIFNEKSKFHSELKSLSDLEKHNQFPVAFPDKPLLAFMGNTVANPDKEGENDEVSDINIVLNYLARLHGNSKRTINYIFNEAYAGKLRLTRNRNVKDEILLSYGDGDYWGIVNVGNGDKFFSDIEDENIEKRVVDILDDKYLFKNLDNGNSPINILIGSRKFAEGWNSYRLSVIGLINLGSSRGNKIIQIFGRGVRLRGHNGDGKRLVEDHNEDYYGLNNPNSDNISKQRALETLTIFSLRRSYLETFIKEIQKDITLLTFNVPVKPELVTLGNGTELKFKVYQKKLNVFKVKKKTTGYKSVYLDGRQLHYAYFDDGDVERVGELKSVKFKLDYRTDKELIGTDISVNLKEFAKINSSLFNDVLINRNINKYCTVNELQIFSKNGSLRKINHLDLLELVEELKYKDAFTENLELSEKLVNKVCEDVIVKLKNKINHHINSNNYIFNEPIMPSTEEIKGDFLYQYTITKKFESEESKKQFLQDYEHRKNEIIEEFNFIVHNPHIYKPLFKDYNSDSEVKISPDILNIGERKFLRDIYEYVEKFYRQSSRYEFYLMRNTVGSIGIFLESDESVFYPDFILWIIDTEINKTTIIFLDPKGETGLRSARDFGVNEKAKIGLKDTENDTLIRLEAELARQFKKEFAIHSFILLRDSSLIGKDLLPQSNTNDAQKIKEEFIPKNILRLDWHEYKEDDAREAKSLKLIEGKSYLDIIFEKVL